MALRLNTHQEEDLQFRIGVVTFPQEEQERDSHINLLKSGSNTDASVAAMWNARTEHMVDVQISLTDPSKHRMTVESQDGTSIDLFKSSLPEDRNIRFLAEMFKDLKGEAAKKMKTCKVNTANVGHVESGVKKLKGLKAASAWVIFAPETVQGKAFAAHAPPKSLILGNGYSEQEFDKFNIDGKKVHNIWFPCGFQHYFWMGKKADTPMSLMVRTDKAAMALQKNLTVVYQQSRAYAEREAGWDHMCEGLKSVGQKCYTMGAQNGNKHLGVSPPFTSAGGRKPTEWIDNAVINYEKFKFVYALEHQRTNFGYLTEKLFLPLQAGAIPIYTGDKAALDMIGVNPRSYIYVTPETREAAFHEVQTLLENPLEYQARVAEPVINKAKFAKYFTFHSSTWAQYGDAARQKLVSAIADLC